MTYRYYGGTHRTYKKKNVSRALTASAVSNPPIIVDEDLLGLPVVIQNYLRYVGVVGKKKSNQFFSFRLMEKCDSIKKKSGHQ